MAEPTFVYDSNIDKLAEGVARLNRRAAKLGVSALQLHIGEREVCYTCPKGGAPTVSLDPKTWGEKLTPIGHERAACTLAGEPPKLAGWTFAAVVDHLSNGTITRYPAAEHAIDLTPYRGVDATCDHCNTNRKRHETFIVVHEDSNTQPNAMRVGRNCLRDFLGHQNPQGLIGHLNLWGKAFALIEGAESAGFDSGVTMLELPTFLGHVARQMREDGWLSRGKAYDEGGVATADIAQNLYWAFDPEGDFEPTEADLERGAKALAWGRALTDTEAESSDYLYNLKAVLTDDYIRPKRGGLAASVIVAAERAFEKAQQIVDDAQKSNEHVGSVKERLTLDLKLVGLREIPGFYGISTLHKFEDATGNLFIWFATNPKIIPDPEDFRADQKRAMVVGETLTLAGTVKGHDDFKGRKQTKLSRVSVPKPKKAKKATS